MPIQPEWQDRRGMFQRGRELPDPSSKSSLRRASESSVGDTISEALSKTTTNQSTASSNGNAANGGASAGSAVNYNPGWGSQNRRRSSAASTSGGGMFANLLTHKRGSEDYSERRSSHAEMEGKGGVFGGVWNSTFRGMQKGKDGDGADGKSGMNAGAETKEIRRGVME